MPTLEIEHFRPHVGKQFIADCTPSEVELQLIEASPLLARNASAHVPFLLVFHTPPQRMLLPGRYTMRREGFDPAQIHISGHVGPGWVGTRLLLSGGVQLNGARFGAECHRSAHRNMNQGLEG